ncbi:alpha/beta hydrolase [Streptomyces megasporus]|uniref:alpha/beta hydrolase n=1 Tax=Streptomyces megasporus TaxID=44060 RepID=UPI0006894DEB|nr:alpha/beta hydrolase [Streptomyces megasporus]
MECGLVQTALNGLVEDLREPQRKLKRALNDAKENGMSVGDDGSVTYPAAKGLDGEEVPGGTVRGRAHDLFEERTRPTTPTMPNAGRFEVGVNPKKRLAEDISAVVLGALDDARRVDDQYVRTLSKLTAERGLKVGNAQWADARSDRKAVHKVAGDDYEKGDIPRGKSPEENVEWWKGLSADERDAYVSLYPASIGALDGLPAEVRDSANRVVLQEEQARTAEALAKHLDREPDRYRSVSVKGEAVRVESSEWREWEEERKRLGELDKGMKAIENRFDQTGMSGLPEAYLLGFDTKNLGHAIIANGNPDTADHTAVFVPGTGSRLGDVEKDINRMSDLWRESTREVPGQSVATITWIGYDAPQSAIPIVDGDLVPEATFVSYAKEGSSKLTSFMEGLQVSQGGPDAGHTTVIGHSYGTTVVGDAAYRKNLATDDIVAIASPGMLAPHARDLATGTDHTWSMAAPLTDDVVPLAGKVARLGGFGFDVPTWNGIPYGIGFNQHVPSDESFGANRLATDSKDHSGYWDEDSVSMKNQTYITVGKYGKVENG